MAETYISVLMPVWNGERTLRRAVLSTLAALDDKSELLIHSDGSEDGTEAILKELASDARVKYTHDRDNRGVAHSLNKLRAEAQGKFIARMDADDICLPWRFRAQAKIFETSEVDLLFSTAIRFWTYGPFPVVLPSVSFWMGDERIKRKLPTRNPLIHPTLFTLNEIFSSMPAYPASPAEDYALWLEAALSSKIFKTSWAPTILYRLHPKQVSRGSEWASASEKDPKVSDLRRKLQLALLDENRELG